MKPFMVAVCPKKDFTPSRFSIDLSTPDSAIATAPVLVPPQDTLARIELTHMKEITQRESILKACEEEYLAALRQRYGKGGRRAEFEVLIQKPLLVVGIGVDPQAMTWEWWALQSVLAVLAQKQGREPIFCGRVLPTLLPQKTVIQSSTDEADASPAF